MDCKTSIKETRFLPSGPAEVLTNSVFDLYPVYDTGDPDLIVDIEMLDNDVEELIDRATFAAVRQRGMDPLNPEEGIQWAEYSLGEVPAPTILYEVTEAVAAEGSGVRATAETVVKNGDSFVVFKVGLV